MWKKKKKVESGGGTKLAENFHRQKEENRLFSGGKISLFPNPNTIYTFIKTVHKHRRSIVIVNAVSDEGREGISWW